MNNFYSKNQLGTYCKVILLSVSMFFLSLQIEAQVTSDGNVQFQSAASTTVTMSGFSVPAGSNSVLVVYSCGFLALATNVTFDGTPLTLLQNSTGGVSLSIWYLALGDLASPSVGDIVATYGNYVVATHTIHAVSYQNADQSTPMSEFAQNAFGGGTSSSISVNSSDANDLIVDFIVARSNDSTTPTLTEGAGQTKIGEQTNQQSAGGLVSTIALSEEPSPGSAVDMDWTIAYGTTGVNTSMQVAAKINAVSSGSGPVSNSIPTLSEWGLIILALLFMTFGTLYLVQPNVEEKLGR
ncbi:MAG: IPTL-CTERM sorting domain-containing protein [Chitinophagales bacterium]